MGCYKMVNLVFLIVGHTKNAKNVFTMQGMVHALSALELVMMAPFVVKDFWDYGALFTNLYQDLSGQVKNNHIFTCNGNDSFVLVIEL